MISWTLAMVSHVLSCTKVHPPRGPPQVLESWDWGIGWLQDGRCFPFSQKTADSWNMDFLGRIWDSKSHTFKRKFAHFKFGRIIAAMKLRWDFNSGNEGNGGILGNYLVADHAFVDFLSTETHSQRILGHILTVVWWQHPGTKVY